MDGSHEPLKFGDCLRRLINDNGGSSPENLIRISELLREHEPTLSPNRLTGLLGLQQPSTSERRAISQVLEPPDKRWLSESWDLENVERRGIATFAAKYTKSHVLAKEFVEFVEEGSYRTKTLSAEDLRRNYYEFEAGTKRLEAEIELFWLSDTNG